MPKIISFDKNIFEFKIYSVIFTPWNRNYDDRSRSSQSSPEEVGEIRKFFTIFQYSPLGIISLGPAILKQNNPINEVGGILVFQKFLQRTNDFFIVFKMVTIQVELEFRKQEGVRQLNLVSKGDGITIQSRSWLLQLLQPEQYERARYFGARAHLQPAFRHDCFLHLT